MIARAFHQAPTLFGTPHDNPVVIAAVVLVICAVVAFYVRNL